MRIGAELVGRDRELPAVIEGLSSAMRTPLLVVAGEAGIGKSHLLSTAVDEVTAQGRVVLRGWCLDLWEQLPFLPVVDVLRDLAGRDDGRLLKGALASCPGYVEQEIPRLVPELAAGEPALDSVGDIAPWRRERVFAAVQVLLSAVAEAVPVAVVIEDVHWADPSTQDLLRYLTAPAHRSGVPTVVTTRIETDDAARLRDLVSSAGASWLELEPLDERETAVLIASTGQRRASEVRRIFERSGGNPLFVEQLAAAANDAPLPPTLDALFTRQLAALGPAERDLLRAMAVVGRPVDDITIGALVEGSSADIAGSLRTLIARRLIERTGGNEHLVHHALLAEAARAEMTAAESREIHARAAVVLAARDDSAIAGDVAEHFAAIGDLPSEARWRLRAARYADSVAAPVEASRQWRRLVELSNDERSTFADLDLPLVDLYLQCLSALERAGEGRDAATVAEEALTRLGPSMEQVDEVRLYFAVGRWRAIADPRGAIPLLEHAISVGQALSPSRDYLRAVHQLAQVASNIHHLDYPNQAELISAGLRAARAAQLRSEEKLLTAALGWRTMAQARRAEALDLVDRALAITLDPPDPWSDVIVAVYATDVALKLGELQQVVDFAAAALDAAQLAGYPRSFEAGLVLSNMMEALREQGRIPQGASLAERFARETATRSSAPAHTEVAAVRLAQGDFAAAARFWDDPSGLLRAWGLQFDREFALLHDEYLLWQDRAVEVVPEALAVLEPVTATEESAMAGGLFVLALRACADRAADARACGDSAALTEALADADRLARLLEQCAQDPFTDSGVPANAVADGESWRAEWARAYGDNDAAAWERAASAWTALGRPHRAAYALWRQAEALLGDPYGRTDATPVLRAAALAAREHVPLTTAITALAHRAHITLNRSTPENAPQPAARPFDLTERELEVLTLVADGRTNGQIGTRLFMSPKTASVHVSSILRKMQVTSRVQAAAVAVQFGLVDHGSD